MVDKEKLCEVLSEGVSLRLVEEHIYSLYPPGENTNEYDRMGGFYDRVLCSRLYNRLVWGYRIEDFNSLCFDALPSTKEGWVLDAGCGSLAFTAKTYAQYSERPIVFLDQSITLLQIAKSRLITLHGEVPLNCVFLHADALQLPFKPKSFSTIICLNLLHVMQDALKALRELKNVVSDGGTMSFTTLIENNRWADRYIRWLSKSGLIIPRNATLLQHLFSAADLPVTCRIQGNMAFIHYREP